MFKEIKVTEIPFSVFELKNKWMLITASKGDQVNTMTASWGGFGIMWNKEVAFVVIRPQRYTKEFVDNSESFSLSFFNDSFKKQLSYLGSTSGRDENKIEKAGLTVAYEGATPYFTEAETVITVKKLYAQPMEENCFIEKDIIDKWYKDKDFHILYIAEIEKVLQK